MPAHTEPGGWKWLGPRGGEDVTLSTDCSGFDGEGVLACEAAGVVPMVPTPDTSPARGASPRTTTAKTPRPAANAAQGKRSGQYMRSLEDYVLALLAERTRELLPLEPDP